MACRTSLTQALTPSQSTSGFIGVDFEVPSAEEPKVLYGYFHTQTQLWFLFHRKNLDRFGVIPVAMRNPTVSLL